MFCWLQALSVTSFLLALYAVTSLASPDHTPTLYPGTEYWAEVAGLMVTLPSQHPERLEAAAAASTPASASASARHVLVVNEYRGSQLIRQSAAVRESSSPDNMTSGLVSHCRIRAGIYFFLIFMFCLRPDFLRGCIRHSSSMCKFASY